MHAIKSNAYFEQTQCILWVRGSQSQLMRAITGVMFCLLCMHQTFHVEALGLQSQLMRWHKKRAMHVMIYYIADMEGAYFTIANHAQCTMHLEYLQMHIYIQMH